MLLHSYSRAVGSNSVSEKQPAAQTKRYSFSRKFGTLERFIGNSMMLRPFQPLILGLWILTCACGGLTFQAWAQSEVTSQSDLTYARYGNRELKLDLYRPADAKEALPAIVCIHGGGWFKGDRSSMTKLAEALAARRFVTVSISYRLSGEAKFPAAIQDCKAAVRWLRANAAVHGIKADSIGVTGLSAGGHLAALLAASGGVAELEGEGGHPETSSRVQACMAMGAQSDLECERIRELSSRPNDPFYRTFLGASQPEIPQVYALASPRHHLDPTDPPLAFMAGELDDASTHADETRRDLMKLGLPTGLTLIPKAPHAFIHRPEALAQCVEVSAAFFHQHLDPQ